MTSDERKSEKELNRQLLRLNHIISSEYGYSEANLPKEFQKSKETADKLLRATFEAGFPIPIAGGGDDKVFGSLSLFYTDKTDKDKLYGDVEIYGDRIEYYVKIVISSEIVKKQHKEALVDDSSIADLLDLFRNYYERAKNDLRS